MISFAKQRKIINEGVFPTFFLFFHLYFTKLISFGQNNLNPFNYLDVKTHIAGQRFKPKTLGRDTFCHPHGSWPHLVILVILHSCWLHPLGEGKGEILVRERKKAGPSSLCACGKDSYCCLLLPKFECLTWYPKYKSILVHIYMHTCIYKYIYICTPTHEEQQSVLFLCFAVISKFSIFM